MPRFAFLFFVIAPATFGSAYISPVQAADPIDPTAYANALSASVNAEGFVDYQSLLNNRAELDHFVDQLAAIDPDQFAEWSEKEQLALWINAYNALTLKAVIDHYPIKSIRDLGNPIRSVWERLNFDVMGRTVTLDHIEHAILRKQFNEPRIHMAINCASFSCPPLLNEPFEAERLDDQFTKVTRIFASRPSNVRIDRDNATIYLSSLFNWFGDDFIPQYGNGPQRRGLNRKEQASVNFLAGYLPPADRAFLDAARTLKVKYLDYDWGLNTQ